MLICVHIRMKMHYRYADLAANTFVAYLTRAGMSLAQG